MQQGARALVCPERRCDGKAYEITRLNAGAKKLHSVRLHLALAVCLLSVSDLAAAHPICKDMTFPAPVSVH